MRAWENGYPSGYGSNGPFRENIVNRDDSDRIKWFQEWAAKNFPVVYSEIPYTATSYSRYVLISTLILAILSFLIVTSAMFLRKTFWLSGDKKANRKLSLLRAFFFLALVPIVIVPGVLYGISIDNLSSLSYYGQADSANSQGSVFWKSRFDYVFSNESRFYRQNDYQSALRFQLKLASLQENGIRIINSSPAYQEFESLNSYQTMVSQQMEKCTIIVSELHNLSEKSLDQKEQENVEQTTKLVTDAYEVLGSIKYELETLSKAVKGYTEQIKDQFWNNHDTRRPRNNVVIAVNELINKASESVQSVAKIWGNATDKQISFYSNKTEMFNRMDRDMKNSIPYVNSFNDAYWIVPIVSAAVVLCCVIGGIVFNLFRACFPGAPKNRPVAYFSNFAGYLAIAAIVLTAIAAIILCVMTTIWFGGQFVLAYNCNNLPISEGEKYAWKPFDDKKIQSYEAPLRFDYSNLRSLEIKFLSDSDISSIASNLESTIIESKLTAKIEANFQKLSSLDLLKSQGIFSSSILRIPEGIVVDNRIRTLVSNLKEIRGNGEILMTSLNGHKGKSIGELILQPFVKELKTAEKECNDATYKKFTSEIINDWERYEALYAKFWAQMVSGSCECRKPLNALWVASSWLMLATIPVVLLLAMTAKAFFYEVPNSMQPLTIKSLSALVDHIKANINPDQDMSEHLIENRVDISYCHENPLILNDGERTFHVAN